MKKLSRPITSGELALGIIALAVAVGTAHGALLAGSHVRPERAVAAVATGAEATKQVASSGEVKSSAPQSCTEAISRALGKDRDPAATTVDKGQSGKLDACFGAVIKKGKKPSQNQADYDCVGRSGKVTLSSGTVTSTTNPNSGVTKGKCSVQVCQSSGSGVTCGDPKTADGTAPIPKYEEPTSAPDTGGDGKSPETVISGAGQKYETLDGAFKDAKPGTEPDSVAPDQGTKDPYQRLAEQYGAQLPETNPLGSAQSNWLNNQPLTETTDLSGPYEYDPRYNLGDLSDQAWKEDVETMYSSPDAGNWNGNNGYDLGDTLSNRDWMSDTLDQGVIDSPELITDSSLSTGSEGFQGSWQVDTAAPESSFDVSPHEVTDFNGAWNPQTDQTPSIGFEPDASLPQFDSVPLTTPSGDYSGIFGNAPSVPGGDTTFSPEQERPGQIWSDSWWQSSGYADATTPDTSSELPRSEWDPKITLPTDITDADRIAAYEVTLPYDVPSEFKDRVGQSGIFSSAVDITEPPAHIATEFNPNLRTDIVSNSPGTTVADPWSPQSDRNTGAIDISSLSEAFGETKHAVAGLPPMFITWGQVTFYVKKE